MNAMTPLEELRHSTAHILAAAVLRLYPNTRLDIGPPTSNGFYYDFDSEHRFSTEDFATIEREMQNIISENQPFIRKEVTREEAHTLFRDLDQPFKLSRLDDILESDSISIYTNGEFNDLCAGSHIESTGKVAAFKLTSVSGSYHRGDHTQPMLQRIYGTAFPSQQELDDHMERMEQAALRDHRKIGQELKLFSLDSKVGSGLPLLLPKGAVIRQQLEKLINDKLFEYGYETLYSPHIGNIDLFKTSGHYPYYAESMYEPITIDEREFLLKPMNCPMHIQAYNAEPRSYRDLPQRYAEFGTVYRMEQSGELSGLTRVRGFTQDDGHVFCTRAQLKQEFTSCLQLVQEVMAVFGLKTECRISLRDPNNTSKYVGADELWQPAERCIREVVDELDLTHSVGLGEAAFYGPKLDFMALDSLGRSWQLGTIQVDFSLPERFKLEYVGNDNKPHRPVMIHRAVFGSIERFMGLLIEHYAGDFPTWLAPEQLRIIPISDAQIPDADALLTRCKALRIRASIDTQKDKMGAKIRRARLDKVPLMAIIGKREAAASQVAVRSRKEGDEGTVDIDAFLKRIDQEAQSNR
ncbi:threonine--tRNA ligase [Rubritalea spongiae]|uniref:Threonine--tRNA ligase n=2 Tax=Rubritalea spongiae TaxID=430797 RepID=A0ABW5DZX9_9BACT